MLPFCPFGYRTTSTTMFKEGQKVGQKGQKGQEPTLVPVLLLYVGAGANSANSVNSVKVSPFPKKGMGKQEEK